MCREGYFLFKKKRIWASKFFYRTSNLLFHLSCGQVNFFLICQSLKGDTSRTSRKNTVEPPDEYNDYTTHSPGCVTAMVKDIGWENLQDPRYIAKLSLLYKMQHGLVDVYTSSYL